MVRRRTFIVLAVSLMTGVLVLPAAGGAVSGQESPEPVALSFSPTGATGEFHPLQPQRIYDSRTGVGTAPGLKPIIGTGAVFDVQILGVGGVPASVGDVYAVVANVTVIQPTVNGVLSSWPSGEPPPSPMTSNINYKPGQIVPNLTVLRPGADGKSRLSLQGQVVGQAHVAVDVFGWISASAHPTRGARLVSVIPGRLYDSRQSGGPLTAGASRSVQVRGASGASFTVPNDPNVIGAVLNVTGINNRPGSTNTYISVLPSDPVGQPSTSNLNLAPGVTRANLVIVPLGPDGRVTFYNAAGETNVAADLVGFLRDGEAAGSRAGRIIPMSAPFRALDTRVGPNGPVRLPPGQAEKWRLAPTINGTTVNSAPIGNVGSLIGTLTGTGFVEQYPGYGFPTNTFLSITPNATPPTSSNLNFGVGEAVANLTLARLSLTADREFWVYNAEGYVHYLFDISAMVLAD